MSRVSINNMQFTYHKVGFDSSNSPLYHMSIRVYDQPFLERLSHCRRNMKKGFYIVSSYDINSTVNSLLKEVSRKVNKILDKA